MGRPSQIQPRRQGANRRDFFRRSGSAALALGAVSDVQTFGTAFEVRAGSNRLAPSAQTPSLPGAAPLAP